MSVEQLPDFTPAARQRWETIPADIRPKLLANDYFVHCEKETTITNFKGTMQGLDLLLIGECLLCHEGVARVIEGA